jgi:hypothetical protein
MYKYYYFGHCLSSEFANKNSFRIRVLFQSFGDPRYERQNVIFRALLTLHFREVALVVFKDGQDLKIIANQW